MADFCEQFRSAKDEFKFLQSVETHLKEDGISDLAHLPHVHREYKLTANTLRLCALQNCNLRNYKRTPFAFAVLCSLRTF